MMKNIFSLLILLSALTTTMLHAEPYTPMRAEDILREVTIHQRPSDFASAQHLAWQSRAERVERIQEIITCIDQAANMDDILSCQTRETDALAKIRLAYCNTNVSWPDRKKMQGEAARGFEIDASECEKVMSGLTGRALKKKGDQPQEDVTVIPDEGVEPEGAPAE